MNPSKKIFVRPSQLVLIGDQLMIAFGLLSSLFCYFRLLSIDDFPVHTIAYRLCVQMIFGIIFWYVFRINKKVIRFFTSKDYLNLIFILFLIHFANITSGLFFPKKHQLKRLQLLKNLHQQMTSILTQHRVLQKQKHLLT